MKIKNHQSTTIKPEFEAVLKEISPIIHHFATQTYVKFTDREDVEQELTIAAWRAYEEFDPTRQVSLGSYIWPVLDHRSKELMRNEHAQKRGRDWEVISIDAPTTNSTTQENIGTLAATLKSNDLLPHELCELRALTSLVEQTINTTQNETARQVCRYLLAGYTQVEVAEKCGCSQGAVSYHLKKMRERLKKAMADDAS